MDKKIEKQFIARNKRILIFITVVLLFFLSFELFGFDGKVSFKTKKSILEIITVKKELFEDYVPITGFARPIRSILLDAVSGGKVEHVYVEDGEHIKEGKPIATLTNTQLVLDVMQRQAQLFEQENQLRNTRLLFEQNKLQLDERLSSVEYSILRVKRNYMRDKRLYEKDLISEYDLNNSKEEYEYQKQQKRLTKLSIKKDSIFRITQINQLENSVKRLTENFKIVQTTLEKLTIRAPITGQLNGLNLQIGETVRSGDKIGQIDILEGYKIEAFVDEFYLSRLRNGLNASAVISGEEYTLKLAKIYPRVANGQVKVDLEFSENKNLQIQQGQRVQLKLSLGDEQEKLLLKRGTFFSSTGGHWIYILDKKENKAVKRNIKLGRQNPLYYEVNSGLNEGDKVIISSYESFGDAEQILIGDGE